MSSQKFADLIAKAYPDERDAIHRLQTLVDVAVKTGRRQDIPIERIAERVEPQSDDRFVRILADLVSQGFIQYVVRVESPKTHGGIKDFASIRDVPPKMHDEDSGETFTVSPDTLRFLYRLGT